MSHLPPHWEADLRQKINDHEFPFDPTGWKDMAVLLDSPLPGASSDTGSPVPGARGGSISLWNIFFLTAISLLTLAVFVLYQRQNAPAPVLGSWSVSSPAPVPEVVVTTTSHPVIESTTNQRKRTDFSSPQSRFTFTVAPLPQKRIGSVRSRPKKVTLLPGTPLPDTIIPITLPPAFNLPKIQVRPRKRNRKTLFPDVLDN